MFAIADLGAKVLAVDMDQARLDDAWSDLVNLNLSTAYWTGQAVGREMCAAGYGRMIFLSLVSGLLAHAHHAPYAATKGGLNQLPSGSWPGRRRLHHQHRLNGDRQGDAFLRGRGPLADTSNACAINPRS